KGIYESGRDALEFLLGVARGQLYQVWCDLYRTSLMHAVPGTDLKDIQRRPHPSL
ncbi:hypothetical protein B484DRAFT_447552, partial [Ochromonadaceae sp. CCMP2298]